MAAILRIGVLALQGNFREHVAMLRRLGAEPVEVRKPEQLDGIDGLIVPGGESTAIRRLMRVYELEEPLAAFRGPLFGTCAGMILFDREHLGLLDMKVLRNGYGRQVASFEADVDLEGEDEPVRGVFIRAPRVEDLGDEVEVVGRLGDEPVLVREGRILAASFHPELTDDTRIHERFLELVREERHVRA
jgi:pyridoxal 5'-phosphate synthase pdxT subunit